MIANRVKGVKPSMTIAVISKVRALKASGVKVIDFGAGEPDFPTPGYIKAAAVKAIEENFTRYTPANGIPELRTKIAEKLEKQNNLKYTKDEIIVGAGGKQEIFNAMQVLVQEGDEVIIPAPYWVSYPDVVVLAGGKPVIAETREQDDFGLSPETLSKLITNKTKMIILNSPRNPTGTVYSKEDLEKLAEVLSTKEIYMLSDDVYEYFIYSGEPHLSIANINSRMKDYTIVINSFSKTYSMTGWRIGYAAGPRKIIDAMNIFQGQATSNPNSIAQKACLAALSGGEEELKNMVSAFRKRRDYTIEELNKIPGIKCSVPKGAFYAFFSIADFVGKKVEGREIKDCLSFAELLLEKEQIAVVPGVSFGAPNYIRLSYATNMEDIKEGISRLQKLLSRCS
ncbi:MAG: pyridoxal phosphate-dependent aminotransferase [Planctomycetota bacterium]